MTVYNSKTDKVRQVEIKPTTNWNGTGLLGVSIKFDSFESARKNVWHILNVEPNSPAELAGLQSNCDYVIGADSLLQDSEDLYALIDAHDGKPLKLFVYNLLTDSVRDVVITPNSRWGGEGLLGCGIGYGYLHRIPDRPKSEFSNDHTPLMHAMEDETGGEGVHSQNMPQMSPNNQAAQQYQEQVPFNPSTSITEGNQPSSAQPASEHPVSYAAPISSGTTTKLSLPGMNPITVTVPPMPPHLLQPQPISQIYQLPSTSNYTAPLSAVTVPTNTITSPISIPGITSAHTGSYLAPEDMTKAVPDQPPPPPPNSLAEFSNMPRFEDLRISSTQPVSNYPSYMNEAISNVNIPYSQPSQPYSSMVSSNFSQNDYSSSNYPANTSYTLTTTAIDFSKNSNI